MTSKLVTIKSCPQTNCSEPITNRFKQNKKRCHWPTGSTRQKKTYKTYSLTTNPQISNSTKQSNTQPQSKPGSPCNCRRKRDLSKRIAYLQKEKQSTQPYNSCFSSLIRKRSPCCWQTICRSFLVQKNIFLHFKRRRKRTILFSTPFQMNTFQSLSIPKTNNRFTKSRQSTIPCKCMRVIQRMISSQNQYSKSNSYKPDIHTQHRPHKWQMKTHQRYTLPCFNCRSLKKTKICIHYL